MARPKKSASASIVWLGEDHLHEDGNGPRKNVWNGITFEKDKPVTIDNPHMIAKAKGNPFYSVDGKRSTEDEEEQGSDVIFGESKSTEAV